MWQHRIVSTDPSLRCIPNLLQEHLESNQQPPPIEPTLGVFSGNINFFISFIGLWFQSMNKLETNALSTLSKSTDKLPLGIANGEEADFHNILQIFLPLISFSQIFFKASDKCCDICLANIFTFSLFSSLRRFFSCLERRLSISASCFFSSDSTALYPMPGQGEERQTDTVM